VHFASVPEGAPAADALRDALTAPDGKRNASLIKALEKVEPEGPPTAGLVSFDQFGQAVACTFSLGGPFGTGKMIPGTGIMQAKATGAQGIGGPAVMVNPNLNHPLFAGNGGLIGVGVGEEGAGAAPAALVNVALRAIEQTAERSAAGVEGEIYSVQALGRVNLVSCKVDRSTGGRSCTAATDTRGFGIAYTIE
jgi:gamma-glutamyltranspeptidase/glutathione hydrolase